MNIKYIKLGYTHVFRNKAVLSSFLIEYKKYFHTGNLNPSCSSCRSDYWSKYTKLFEMKKTVKCDYELHSKYNGINLGVNGRPIRNGEMTNEIAKELLDKHPRGSLLFSKIPVKKTRKPGRPKTKKD